jgi:PTH1 family peptidyl-tRNA hydrolase
MGLIDLLWRLLGRGRLDPLAALSLDADPEHTRLIVGLGNPGPEYADTRHNVGFKAVEELARRYGATWHDRTHDLHSLIAVTQADDITLVLAKPQNFMNRSGAAVQALLAKFGIQPQQALVVFDDMDLPLGTLRLRERGSPGTHNGMRSVIASVKTDDIPRLRLGISQSAPGAATTHVLTEFEPDDRDAVEALVERAADAAVAWALDGAAAAMNRYNSVRT